MSDDDRTGTVLAGFLLFLGLLLAFPWQRVADFVPECTKNTEYHRVVDGAPEGWMCFKSRAEYASMVLDDATGKLWACKGTGTFKDPYVPYVVMERGEK